MDTNNSDLLTAIATVLLVLVGVVQIYVLFSQKKQMRIALTEQYRQLWDSLKSYWGTTVFLGRESGAYYQILDEESIYILKNKIANSQLATPEIWALESIQKVCGTLGEVSTRVLQGHLQVADIYPIFGTQFLRQTNPLRKILDPNYEKLKSIEIINDSHDLIRNKIQDWIIYHDGLRRRCLILIDLLWAEAARLNDLPPDDLLSAANAKIKTGKLNRIRVFKETIKLNGWSKIILALKLSLFLKNAEYRSLKNWSGINKKELNDIERKWINRLLRS